MMKRGRARAGGFAAVGLSVLVLAPAPGAQPPVHAPGLDGNYRLVR